METSKLSFDSAVTRDRKSIRFSVDLTPNAARELSAIKADFGLTSAEVFRFGLLLMRIYTESKSEGRELHVVDPKNPRKVHVVSLPLFDNSG